MKKIYTINNDISVEVITKKKRTSMFLIKNNVKTLLTTMETWDAFFCKLAYDNNYIVVYSRGTMANQIPLNIEVAYSIKYDKYLNMRNERLKLLLKCMVVSKRGCELKEVLAAINNKPLGLVEPGDENKLIKYLLSPSPKTKRELAVDYIFECYPMLKKYANLTGPISVVDYKKIAEEIGTDLFWLHMMPVDIDLENIFSEEPKDIVD